MRSNKDRRQEEERRMVGMMFLSTYLVLSAMHRRLSPFFLPNELAMLERVFTLYFVAGVVVNVSKRRKMYQKWTPKSGGVFPRVRPFSVLWVRVCSIWS